MSELSRHPRSWCEVSRQALEANIAVFRARLAEGSRLGVVVKSNAYGHGMAPCARVFLQAGADWLIVNSVDEATTLRAFSRQNIPGVHTTLNFSFAHKWQQRR